MVDVVLRRTGIKDSGKEYALMVRDYNGVEVEWFSLCYLDEYTAQYLNDERITFWDGDPEQTTEVAALRLEHPALRGAWESYQTLKLLVKSNKI